MTDETDKPISDLEKMFTREEVIKCPHMMALLGYLASQHELPRYGWRKEGLRFHYTDAAGLLGIIQEGRLWATDIRFLNDPSEGMFLPERLLDVMSKHEGGNDDIKEKIISGIRKALSEPRSDHATFCASLSADGDLLSQWKGYGGFGQGYAIGLDFDGRMLPHPQIAQYYDVIYGDGGLDELATDLLDLFVTAYEKWTDDMYDEWASTISVLAKSFKHEKYIEEQESRLICTHDPSDSRFQHELPLRFRARGSEVVPYVSMALDLVRSDAVKPRLPIARIVTGPGVDFERNYSSIKSLLDAYSYNDVEVLPSTIPFRP